MVASSSGLKVVHLRRMAQDVKQYLQRKWSHFNCLHRALPCEAVPHRVDVEGFTEQAALSGQLQFSAVLVLVLVLSVIAEVIRIARNRVPKPRSEDGIVGACILTRKTLALS